MSGASSIDTGLYVLQITERDVGSTSVSALMVDVGRQVVGMIDQRNDRDWFGARLQCDQNYNIVATGSGGDSGGRDFAKTITLQEKAWDSVGGRVASSTVTRYNDVTAENRPGPDDEDYVHIRVIFEDAPQAGHASPHTLPQRHGRPLRAVGNPPHPQYLLYQPEQPGRMTTPASPTPVPIDWANLIQAGRDILNPRQLGRLPTHEHVRRAVSNAYYAMFQALAQSNASEPLTKWLADP